MSYFKLNKEEFNTKTKEFHNKLIMVNNNQEEIKLLFEYVIFLWSNDKHLKKPFIKREIMIDALWVYVNALEESADDVYFHENKRINILIKSIENSQIMDTGEQLDAEELFENYKEDKKYLKWVGYEDFVEALNIINNERIGPWARKLSIRHF